MVRNKKIEILFIFIIFILLLSGCNNYICEKIPCEILSCDTYEGQEIEGLGKGEGGTIITVTYEFRGKEYQKEFNLQGKHYFKPGSTWYCIVNVDDPDFVRLEDKGDVAP